MTYVRFAMSTSNRLIARNSHAALFLGRCSLLLLPLASYTSIPGVVAAFEGARAEGDPVQDRKDAAKADLERSKRFEAIQALPAANRAKELLKIVRDGEEVDVLYAAPMLIDNEELKGEALDVLTSRLKTVSEYSRRAIINRMRFAKRDERYAAIARQALEDIARGEKQDIEAEQAVGLVGDAASLLLKSGMQESDTDLLRSAVHAFPDSFAVWIVLAKHGLAGAEECKIARKVYEDKENLPALRVGAAVACAGDEQARQFVLREVRVFLEEFGSRSLEDLFPSGWQDEAAQRLFGRLRRDRVLVALLVALDSPEAQDLTFKYLWSPNLEIRNVVHLVVAQKWPDRLLDTTGADPSDEAKQLVGLAVHFHPQLRSVVEGRIPKAEFDKRLQAAKAIIERPVYGEAERLVIEWEGGQRTVP